MQKSTYKIALSSPLGLKYGSMLYMEDGEKQSVQLTLFGYQSVFHAEKTPTGLILFEGMMSSVIGQRPCSGEMTVDDSGVSGRLTLRGLHIPLKGKLEKKELTDHD